MITDKKIAIVGWMDRTEEFASILSRNNFVYRIGTTYNGVSGIRKSYCPNSNMKIILEKNHLNFLHNKFGIGNTPPKLWRSFLLRNEVDLFHIHMINYSLCKYVFGRKPVVLTVHGYLSNESLLSRGHSYDGVNHKIFKIIEKRGINNVDAIIAVDSTIYNNIKNSFKIDEEKLFCIPNGINSENFFSSVGIREQCRMNMVKENEFLILCFREFDRKNGVEILLKMMNILVNEQDERQIKLLLVGGGPLFNTFTEFIKKNQLEKNVTIRNRIPRQEIPTLLSACDINVNTFTHIPNVEEQIVASMKEALDHNLPISTSNTTLEGLCSGKCTVVCTVGGIYSGMKKTDPGVLLPDNDEYLLADVVLKLVNDKKLRDCIGINGRNYIIKNRSWEQIAAKIEDVYSFVLT
jgi:glycosyltransferase involved in cell wall biosynthesis